MPWGLIDSKCKVLMSRDLNALDDQLVLRGSHWGRLRASLCLCVGGASHRRERGVHGALGAPMSPCGTPCTLYMLTLCELIIGYCTEAPGCDSKNQSRRKKHQRRMACSSPVPTLIMSLQFATV